MANVLNNLAADIYRAADVVGREAIGFLPCVTLNSDAGLRVAKGDTVRSHFTREPVLNNAYTPSMTIPEGDDQTVDNKILQVNQAANVKIPWTGEDQKHVANGSGFETILGDQFAQAFRKITNTIEIYAGLLLSQNYSRAFGTPGTTPFSGGNFNEVAEIRQILVDNGCPMDGSVALVINTTAGTKLRNQAQLQKVNESGTDATLRRGELLNLQNISLHESAGVGVHVKGTNNGAYLANFPAGYAIGDGCFGKVNSTIALDTGAGTIVVGDYLVFTGDANKYGVATALAAGALSIGEVGLRQALADNVAVAGPAANFTANMAFHKRAIEMVVRPPALPKMNGKIIDAALDRMTVQDPYSNLVYEIAVYGGYGKMMIDITTLYDGKVWLPEWTACLLG